MDVDLILDRDLCVGYGSCIDEDPEAIELAGDGCARLRLPGRAAGRARPRAVRCLPGRRAPRRVERPDPERQHRCRSGPPACCHGCARLAHTRMSAARRGRRSPVPPSRSTAVSPALVQRTVARVLVDESHAQAWTIRPEIAAAINPSHPGDSSYAAAAALLAGRDFEVAAHTAGALTPAILADVDVLVVPHMSDPRWEKVVPGGAPVLLPAELDAIEAFVRAGGGLVVLAEEEQDKYGSNLGELLARFDRGRERARAGLRLAPLDPDLGAGRARSRGRAPRPLEPRRRRLLLPRRNAPRDGRRRARGPHDGDGRPGAGRPSSPPPSTAAAASSPSPTPTSSPTTASTTSGTRASG